MAVGEWSVPDMPAIAGLKLASIHAGIKANGRDDLVLIELPQDSVVAGVYTQNDFCAAPVTLNREHLNCTANSRYLLINSGNANACTGDLGMQAARASCMALAELCGVDIEQVLPFSTGVIGERLPVEKIISTLPEALAQLSEGNWAIAAQGIMTTDTHPKLVTKTVEIAGKFITINGMAKGAGMINPNMATMLAYVATDAGLSPQLANIALTQAADLSFNRITVDGDTSTNDSCMLMTTGGSGLLLDKKDSPEFTVFQQAFEAVMTELAQMIVRDAEGATKFLTVQIEEGASTQECLDVAYAIAHSPLVKTALFASDPNWGRIVCAVGYAGIESLNVESIKIYLGDVLIVEHGGVAANYTEEAGQKVMDQAEIILRVCLGRGEYSETLWTSDLSHEYVRINAEYRS